MPPKKKKPATGLAPSILSKRTKRMPAESTAAASSSTPPSTCRLDASFFPDIVDTIFNAASFSALLRLRDCSRDFRDAADRRLAHHAVLAREASATQNQFRPRIIVKAPLHGHALRSRTRPAHPAQEQRPPQPPQPVQPATLESFEGDNVLLPLGVGVPRCSPFGDLWNKSHLLPDATSLGKEDNNNVADKGGHINIDGYLDSLQRIKVLDLKGPVSGGHMAHIVQFAVSLHTVRYIFPSCNIGDGLWFPKPLKIPGIVFDVSNLVMFLGNSGSPWMIETLPRNQAMAATNVIINYEYTHGDTYLTPFQAPNWPALRNVVVIFFARPGQRAARAAGLNANVLASFVDLIAPNPKSLVNYTFVGLESTRAECFGLPPYTDSKTGVLDLFTAKRATAWKFRSAKPDLAFNNVKFLTVHEYKNSLNEETAALHFGYENILDC